MHVFKCYQCYGGKKKSFKLPITLGLIEGVWI